MLYNKNQFKEVNDQKVLHKIKKHWVVVSMALLGALGSGVLMTNKSANASALNSNYDNDQVNHQVNLNSVRDQHVALTNSPTHQMTSSTITSNNSSSVDSAKSNETQISQKATNLHQNIIQNNIANSSAGSLQDNANHQSNLDHFNQVKSYSRSAIGDNNTQENNGPIKSLRYTENFDASNLRINYYTIHGSQSGHQMNLHDLAEISAIDPSKEVTFDSRFMTNLPYDRDRYDWGFSIDPKDNVELTDSSKGENFSARQNGIWSHFQSIDLNNLHTSDVTNMSGMFADDDDLRSLSINNLDTSKVTDMSDMFQNDVNLSDLNVRSWDTSQVTDMANMFRNDSMLSKLDLHTWDTDNVVNMSSMFRNLPRLKTLNLNGFNTSNVTNMTNLFNGDAQLGTLNLNDFDTINVNNMQGMFYGDKSLGKLSLGTQFVIPGDSSLPDYNIQLEGSIFSSDQNLYRLSLGASTDLNIDNARGQSGSPFFDRNVNSDGIDTTNRFNNNGTLLDRGIYYKAVNTKIDLYNNNRNNILVDEPNNYQEKGSVTDDKLLDNRQQMLIPTNPDSAYHPGPNKGDITSQLNQLESKPLNNGYYLNKLPNQDYQAKPTSNHHNGDYLLNVYAKGDSIKTNISVDATFAAPKGITPFSQWPNENQYTVQGQKRTTASSENHRIIMQKQIQIPITAHVGDHVTVDPLDFNSQGYRIATQKETSDLNHDRMTDDYAARYLDDDIRHINNHKLVNSVQGLHLKNPQSFDVTKNLNQSNYPFDFIYIAKPASIDINYVNQHGGQVDPVPMHINGYTNYRFTIGQFPTPAGYQIDNNYATVLDNTGRLTYVVPNFDLLDSPNLYHNFVPKFDLLDSKDPYHNFVSYPGHEGMADRTERFLPDQTLMMLPNDQTNQYKNLNERGEINVNLIGDQENRQVKIPVQYNDKKSDHTTTSVYISGRVGDIIPLTSQMFTPRSGYQAKPAGSVMVNANKDIPFGGFECYSSSSNTNTKVKPYSADVPFTNNNNKATKAMIETDFNHEYQDENDQYNTVNEGISIYNDIHSAYEGIRDGQNNGADLQSLAQQNDQLNAVNSSASQDYAANSSAITSLEATLSSSSTNSVSEYDGPIINGQNDASAGQIEVSSAIFLGADQAADNTSESINSSNVESAYLNDKNQMQEYGSQATSASNLARSIKDTMTSNDNISAINSIINRVHLEMSTATSYTDLKSLMNSSVVSLSDKLGRQGASVRNSDVASSVVTPTASTSDNLSRFNTSLSGFTSSLASITSQADSVNNHDYNAKQIGSLNDREQDLQQGIQSIESIYNNNLAAVQSLSSAELSVSNVASQDQSQLISLSHASSRSNQVSRLNTLRSQANSNMLTAANDAGAANNDQNALNSMTDDLKDQIASASTYASQARSLLANVKPVSSSNAIASADPITVTYVDQNGKLFNQRIIGGLDQNGSDITRLAHLPAGYHLNAGQNLSYQFTSQPQAKRFNITGNQVKAMVSITINRQTSTGMEISSGIKPVEVSGLVGNTYQIKPTDYVPSGYQATNNDQNVTGQFMSNGVSTPKISYNYTQIANDSTSNNGTILTRSVNVPVFVNGRSFGFQPVTIQGSVGNQVQLTDSMFNNRDDYNKTVTGFVTVGQTNDAVNGQVNYMGKYEARTVNVPVKINGMIVNDQPVNVFGQVGTNVNLTDGMAPDKNGYTKSVNGSVTIQPDNQANVNSNANIQYMSLPASNAGNNSDNSSSDSNSAQSSSSVSNNTNNHANSSFNNQSQSSSSNQPSQPAQPQSSNTNNTAPDDDSSASDNGQPTDPNDSDSTDDDNDVPTNSNRGSSYSPASSNSYSNQSSQSPHVDLSINHNRNNVQKLPQTNEQMSRDDEIAAGLLATLGAELATFSFVVDWKHHFD